MPLIVVQRRDVVVLLLGGKGPQCFHAVARRIHHQHTPHRGARTGNLLDCFFHLLKQLERILATRSVPGVGLKVHRATKTIVDKYMLQAPHHPSEHRYLVLLHPFRRPHSLCVAVDVVAQHGCVSHLTSLSCPAALPEANPLLQ